MDVASSAGGNGDFEATPGAGYRVSQDYQPGFEIQDDASARENVNLAGAPSHGLAGAPITLVEFGDFECPFCMRVQTTLHALEQAYPGQIRFVFKQNPLPIHPHARLAAIAALAADRQGKFWEYSEQLYANPNALDRRSLVRQATVLGLDTKRFSADLDDRSLSDLVDADAAEAKRLDIHGTPTFFVNGRRLTGAQPVPVFKEAIESALRAQKH